MLISDLIEVLPITEMSLYSESSKGKLKPYQSMLLLDRQAFYNLEVKYLKNGKGNIKVVVK